MTLNDITTPTFLKAITFFYNYLTCVKVLSYFNILTYFITINLLYMENIVILTRPHYGTTMQNPLKDKHLKVMKMDK